jgi:hypothetical protein
VARVGGASPSLTQPVMTGMRMSHVTCVQKWGCNVILPLFELLVVAVPEYKETKCSRRPDKQHICWARQVRARARSNACAVQNWPQPLLAAMSSK